MCANVCLIIELSNVADDGLTLNIYDNIKLSILVLWDQSLNLVSIDTPAF